MNLFDGKAYRAMLKRPHDADVMGWVEHKKGGS